MKKLLFPASLLFLAARSEGQSFVTVGAAAAVAGRVTALAPTAGSVGRVMSSGKDVYHKDAIKTDAAGRLQILLLDETVFTIGPKSELTIDEFVYDPKTQKGTVSAQVSKGVFRFVSGKVARNQPSAVKVKIPGGTIGIRGTIVGGQEQANGGFLIGLLGPGSNNSADERAGAANVSNDLGSVNLTRPGFGTILNPGQAPTPAFQLSSDQLSALEAKPAAESGSGDPADSGEQAKETGTLGETKTIAEVVGIETDAKNDDSQSTTNAAQDAVGIHDGDSTWSQVRNSTIKGSGYYSTSGTYGCTGSACGAGSSGSYSTQIDVNFDSRAITGVSFSLISGPISASSSMSGGDIPFGTDGFAAHVFTSGQLSNSSFAGTIATFQNKGGVAGQQMEIDLHFNNGSDSINAGSATKLSDFNEQNLLN